MIIVCLIKEKAELLRLLGEQHDKPSAQRTLQTELMRLKREHHRLLQEQGFDSATLAMGLAQEQEAV